MTITDILADHPDKATIDLAELDRAIEACRVCEQACQQLLTAAAS